MQEENATEQRAIIKEIQSHYTCNEQWEQWSLGQGARVILAFNLGLKKQCRASWSFTIKYQTSLYKKV